MMFDIILPQAFKSIMPSIVNEAINLLKGNSALKTVMCMLYNVLGEKIFHLPYSDAASDSETIEEHNTSILY